MSYRPIKIERETIIIYNEEEETSIISTYHKPLIRQLKKIFEKRFDEMVIGEPDSTGAINIEIPKSWIKIKPTKILTEKNKQELIKRAKNMTNSV